MNNLLDTLLQGFVTLTPATVIGVLAVTANSIWPVMRTRYSILTMQVACSLLFTLHFALLGALTAAAMCTAGAMQGIAMTLLRKRWARGGLFGASIALGLAITAATWSGLPSLLVQTGQLLSATGRLQRREQSIRLFFLVSECFWTAHNFLVGSTWGLVSDVMAFAMILIGLWRGSARHRARRSRTATA